MPNLRDEESAGFLAVVFTALMPLLHNQADLVRLVQMLYEWALLLDKVSHSENKYTVLCCEARHTLRNLQDKESEIWGALAPQASFRDTRDFHRSRQAVVLCYSIRDHCADVVAGFALLRLDVSGIEQFAHHDNSSVVQKKEVETVRNSLIKLLSDIDVACAGWKHALSSAEIDCYYSFTF